MGAGGQARADAGTLRPYHFQWHPRGSQVWHSELGPAPISAQGNYFTSLSLFLVGKIEAFPEYLPWL